MARKNYEFLKKRMLTNYIYLNNAYLPVSFNVSYCRMSLVGLFKDSGAYI